MTARSTLLTPLGAMPSGAPSGAAAMFEASSSFQLDAQMSIAYAPLTGLSVGPAIRRSAAPSHHHRVVSPTMSGRHVPAALQPQLRLPQLRLKKIPHADGRSRG